MATPFFRGNYGSALSRVDTRPILEAGRARGQMFANMGAQVGGMIEEYGLNKEKRDISEAAFQSDFKRIMQNPEQLAAMQADSVIGPTLKRIREGKGNQSDFNKYHAYRAADKEADTLDREKRESDLIAENRRLANRIAQAEGDYAPTILGQKYLEGQISNDRQRENLRQSKELFPLIKAGYVAKLFGGNTPPNLDEAITNANKRIQEIYNTPVTVRKTTLTGGLFGLGEQVSIPYKEYMENTGEYEAPTNQIQAFSKYIEQQSKMLTDAVLSTPIIAKNNKTGEEVQTTFAQKLEHEDAAGGAAGLPEGAQQEQKSSFEMLMGDIPVFNPGQRAALQMGGEFGTSMIPDFISDEVLDRRLQEMAEQMRGEVFDFSGLKTALESPQKKEVFKRLMGLRR